MEAGWQIRSDLDKVHCAFVSSPSVLKMCLFLCGPDGVKDEIIS